MVVPTGPCTRVLHGFDGRSGARSCLKRHFDAAETQNKGAELVDMKLEVVLLPVSDVDRAKSFYEQWGCRLDADFDISEDFRIVQVTPPGSECSIILGKGLTTAEPGSVQGLQLTVFDIEKAREELVASGVDVSEIFHDGGWSVSSRGHRMPSAWPRPRRARLLLVRLFQRPRWQRILTSRGRRNERPDVDPAHLPSRRSTWLTLVVVRLVVVLALII